MTNIIIRYIDQARTPAEIDGEIAELNGDIAELKAKLVRAQERKAYLGEVFTARGGWERAFLVNNPNGHVHNTMNCSTCNNGHYDTEFKWITDLSGSTEMEIIEAAGDKACTVCYPEAPVEVTSRPGVIKSDEEARLEIVRAERAEKAAAKATKAITNPDGTELVVGTGYSVERPKTERSAMNLLGKRIADILLYRREFENDVITVDTTPNGGHPDENNWKADIHTLLPALEAKTGVAADTIYAESLKKAKAKTKKEFKAYGNDYDVELAAKAAGL